MRTADLEAEWLVAQDSLSKSDALELLAAGLPKGVIMHMIGISRISLNKGRYEPHEAGKWAYISPIRVLDMWSPFAGDVISPFAGWWRYWYVVLGGELVDLVCWDVANPNAWALRCGAAEWLGCAWRSEPTPIRRSPVDWLRHKCEGVVLLTCDCIRRYEILSDCNDIIAEDDVHADQLASALRYPYPQKPVFVNERR